MQKTKQTNSSKEMGKGTIPRCKRKSITKIRVKKWKKEQSLDAKDKASNSIIHF